MDSYQWNIVTVLESNSKVVRALGVHINKAVPALGDRMKIICISAYISKLQHHSPQCIHYAAQSTLAPFHFFATARRTGFGIPRPCLDAH